MILDFIISNFTVLMIVAVMCVIVYVNKDLKIPAVSLARVAVILILITAVLDYLNDMAAGLTNYSFPCSPEQLVRLHTALCVFSYILRPVIILIELLIICPDKRLRIPIIVPSVVNALIYLPTLFGRPLAFYFTSDNAWVGIAPFNLTIYLVLIVYLFILLAFSVIYFSKKNRKCSVIILAIVLLSLVVAVLEYFNIMTGYTTTVTAMGTLTYYIYLSTIYQQKIRETVAEKELTLAKNELDLLRSQIQPHFIYNSLSTIRSLAKRDSKKAVVCIDEFSKYLKSHIGAIQSDELVSFESEIDNINAYLQVIQMGYGGKIELIKEFSVTDFKLPTLVLEPIIENAVSHGISKHGGTITISTHEENDNVIIRVTDSGSPSKDKEEFEPIHNGIGLQNTEKRLRLQCSGTLKANFTDSGSTVELAVPRGNAI